MGGSTSLKSPLKSAILIYFFYTGSILRDLALNVERRLILYFIFYTFSLSFIYYIYCQTRHI